MRGYLLFDIDGVLRDVAGSYRLAIQETVNHFSSWRPTLQNIDNLKAEGCWNNDWKASQELIKRYQKTTKASKSTPDLKEIEKVFSGFYFGGDPNGDPQKWSGFITNEPLLINPSFFNELHLLGVQFGFVSGAEPQSAKFVLETRLGLQNPPLIAMGDAPEKPDPAGFIQLSSHLAGQTLGHGVPPVAYLGDTVADVLMIHQARKRVPKQKFVSLAVAPPHLHGHAKKKARLDYENSLKKAGSDKILKYTAEVLAYIKYELSQS